MCYTAFIQQLFAVLMRVYDELTLCNKYQHCHCNVLFITGRLSAVITQPLSFLIVFIVLTFSNNNLLTHLGQYHSPAFGCNDARNLLASCQKPCQWQFNSTFSTNQLYHAKGEKISKVYY